MHVGCSVGCTGRTEGQAYFVRGAHGKQQQRAQRVRLEALTALGYQVRSCCSWPNDIMDQGGVLGRTVNDSLEVKYYDSLILRRR